MNEEVDKILHEANTFAIQETAHLSGKYKSSAIHGTTSRYIRNAEDGAVEKYYKNTGRRFDSRGSEYSPNEQLWGKIFTYTMIALVANIILYAPVYFLLVWGQLGKHNAMFISIIISTAIGLTAWGLLEEKSMKRSAFKAGMRAEAENHIVAKYHMAKNKVDAHYKSKGHLPDDDFAWKE